MHHTYNAVVNIVGEEAGLAYEKMVAAHISGDIDELAMGHIALVDALRGHSSTTVILMVQAKEHAKQEIEEANGARCSGCGSRIKWDFDQDMYQVLKDGSYIFCGYQPTNEDSGVFRCTCGKILAHWHTDADGFHVCNIPSLANINWHLPMNSFSHGE